VVRLTKLTWDRQEYEVGIDRGVFYPRGGAAEAWSGLVSVDEQIVDGTDSALYLDGLRVGQRKKESSFAATVIAHSYPPSFFVSPRSPFGFSYRTKTANSYKIHLVYNVLANLSGQKYVQQDNSPFSIDIATLPIVIGEAKPSAHFVVDASVAYPPVLAAFEEVLYGSDTQDPRFPLLDEVIEVFDANSLYKVIDNGDGTFSLELPDEALAWLEATEFQASWPISPIFIDSDTYTIKSW
jgi:hypothetical protein